MSNTENPSYRPGGIFDWIKSLKDSHVDLYLLVTSRPDEDIKSAIESWVCSEDMIPLQSDNIKEDICSYIHERIREQKGLSRWNSRPDVQKEIEDVLTEKANGM